MGYFMTQYKSICFVILKSIALTITTYKTTAKNQADNLWSVGAASEPQVKQT